MLPAITDKLIINLIQTRRMIDAGDDYWRRGKVNALEVDAKGRLVTATVRGTRAYLVEIYFGDDPAGTGAFGDCSCPVGMGCKHIAATLFALRAMSTAGSALRQTVSQPAAPKPARSPAAPAPPPESEMPPEFRLWFNAMMPVAQTDRAMSETANQSAVYYVVRAHPVEGKAKAGAGKPKTKNGKDQEDLAGLSKRLSMQAFEVPLDDTGRPRTVGKPVSLYQLSYNPRALPIGSTTEDQLLLRRMAARVDEAAGTDCLGGIGGGELLYRAIGTGRAHWHSVRGRRLVWSGDAAGRFSWQADPGARMRLAVAVEAIPQAIIAVLAPPLAIDPASGAVHTIETDVPPRSAEQLLCLPPVPPHAIPALAARWSEIAPANVPPPALPDIRDLGDIIPIPVLSLLIDKVSMRPPWTRGYYAASKSKDPWALARLSFDYGIVRVMAATDDAVLLLRDGSELVRLHRNMAAERKALEWLVDSCLFALGDFDGVEPARHQIWDHAPHPLASAGAFADFLINDAETLRAEGWRIEQAPDFRLTIAQIDDSDLSFDIEPTGTDWFDLALGATIDGERIDLVPMLRRLLEHYTPGEVKSLLDAVEVPEAPLNLPLPLSDGRIAPLPLDRIAPMLRALLLLAAQTPDAGARTGFARHDLGTLAALEEAGGSSMWRGAEPLRALAGRLATLRFEPTPLPPDFAATLRPYQQIGLDWLQALDGAGFGGLLADDMGLGKTVQTLAHIAVLKARGALEKPVLIVAPTSVLPNWQAEIARFTPTLATLLLRGADRHARIGDIATHDIVLTSYPLLARDEKRLADIDFGLIVYDEAHVLKNPRTASHGAARRLKTSRRIALSGTPVENRLTDAWALFDLVVPGLLGTLSAFTRTFRTPIEKHGNAAAKANLSRRLKPFLLRRTKDAVASDLPEKSLIPEMIDMAPDQMALHESQRLLMHKRVRDEIERVGLMRAQIIVLAALTRLRQICCDPRLITPSGEKSAASAKLDRLLEMVEELIPEGRRIILFSQFTSMLDLIKPELDRLNIAWVELTGKTKDRKTPVAHFQAGKVPLILVSLKAGGTGLNLTAADTVLLYDPWWNPAIEAQAIDRAHRIGQTKPVFVHRLIAKGTIEEKILALQARKAAIADTLWSDDAATPALLDEQDIAFLLAE